jgi:hypothetical protein
LTPAFSPQISSAPRATAPTGVLDTGDPVNKFGFYVMQVYLFLLISRAAEFIDPNQHFHLAMITACLGLVCTALNVAVRRAFQTRIGIALAAFSAWVIFELPFSSWRGGSFHALTDSWLKSYLTYVILAALISSFGQLRKALTCVALATGVIVFLSFRMGINSEADSRLSFSGGTFANANDLAMELILGLPFIVQIAADKRRARLLRLLAWLVIPVLLFVVLKTGSRAGLIALLAMGVLLFFRTTAKNRLIIAAVAVVMAAVGPLLLSSDLRARYSTILGGSALNERTVNEQEANVIDSADESKEGRVELIRYAFLLTAHNPIFGVGMFQFAPCAVDLAVSEGKVMGWHPVHSFLLLVMAETGIPGVILYTSVLVFCLRALLRIGKFTRNRKDLGIAREVSETLLYSFVGFVTCMLFSPSAYTFQFPLMAALVTALDLFTKDQMARETREAKPAPFMPAARIAMPSIRRIGTPMAPGVR